MSNSILRTFGNVFIYIYIMSFFFTIISFLVVTIIRLPFNVSQLVVLTQIVIHLSAKVINNMCARPA